MRRVSSITVARGIMVDGFRLEALYQALEDCDQSSQKETILGNLVNVA